jgi:polyisoprenoid-binding protein YceI
MRFQTFSFVALAALAACDNNPAEGKVAAKVEEVQQAPAAPPAAPAAPAAAAPTAATTKYNIAPDNSKVEFIGAKVTGKHNGSFKAFTGSIQAQGASAEGGSVNVEIEVGSLEADVEKLTGHLKSPDLLDAAQFPKASFASTAVTSKGADAQYNVTGNFTLHGVSKQLSFPATIRVQADKVEADAEFAINRKDFGIVYPGKPDDLIKDEVLIKLSIRAPLAQP